MAVWDIQRQVAVNTTKRRFLNIAFVLDARTLHRIADLFTEIVLEQIEFDKHTSKKKIEYRLELSDGTTFTTPNIEEVLGLPNSPARQIRAIDVSTPYSAKEARATVAFKNEMIAPVYYDLRGEERDVLSLSSKLEDEIAGTRQWYTRVTSDRLFLMLLVYGSTIVWLLALAFTILPLFTNLRETIQSSNVLFVSTNILLVLILIVLIALLLLGYKLFPVGTFAIGQGVQRHQRLKTVRIVILTCILFPIPVGIMINFVS